MIDPHEVGRIAAALRRAGVSDFDIGFDELDRPLIRVRPSRPEPLPAPQPCRADVASVGLEEGKLAYSVAEAAKSLSVGKSTVWRWIHERRLKTLKLGSRTVIRREDLEGLLV